jgi:hypothetical protein
MKSKKPASKAIKDALARLGMSQDGDHGGRCSFCGKEEREVEKLIAGASAFICNECVRKCADVLDELGLH